MFRRLRAILKRIQYIFLLFKHLRESHLYHNVSVVNKFVSYYIEGKYELFTVDYLPLFNVISLQLNIWIT
jgi:hypothetical protein